MNDVNSVGLAVAFLGGMVSFLSPCVLPIVPGYLSHSAEYLNNGTSHGLSRRLLAAASGLPFVLGFSTVFVLLGLGVSALPTITLAYRVATNYVAGGVIILFGLFMTGMIRIPWLNREFRFHLSADPRWRIWRGYIMGVAFALGWSPCIGPILGAILTLASTGTMGNATVLMVIYTLGFAVPFLLASATLDLLVGRLRGMARAGVWMQRVSGGLLILTGIAIATGQLVVAESWLLAQFPWFAKIG